MGRIVWLAGDIVARAYFRAERVVIAARDAWRSLGEWFDG